MDLVVEGKDITVEAAVSDALPQSVLLGVDVPELEYFMVNRKESDGSAFVVTTTSMDKREQTKARSLTDEKEGRRGRTASSSLVRQQKTRNIQKQKERWSLILKRICLSEARVDTSIPELEN